MPQNGNVVLGVEPYRGAATQAAHREHRIVGAYIIGFLDTAMTTIIAPSLTGLAGLVMLVVVLLVRPRGLFGRATSS